MASIARLPTSTDDPRASGSTADRHPPALTAIGVKYPFVVNAIYLVAFTVGFLLCYKHDDAAALLPTEGTRVTRTSPDGVGLPTTGSDSGHEPFWDSRQDLTLTT